jgi:hypothetical protein
MRKIGVRDHPTFVKTNFSYALSFPVSPFESLFLWKPDIYGSYFSPICWFKWFLIVMKCDLWNKMWFVGFLGGLKHCCMHCVDVNWLVKCFGKQFIVLCGGLGWHPPGGDDSSLPWRSLNDVLFLFRVRYVTSSFKSLSLSSSSVSFSVKFFWDYRAENLMMNFGEIFLRL